VTRNVLLIAISLLMSFWHCGTTISKWLSWNKFQIPPKVVAVFNTINLLCKVNRNNRPRISTLYYQDSQKPHHGNQLTINKNRQYIRQTATIKSLKLHSERPILVGHRCGNEKVVSMKISLRRSGGMERVAIATNMA
jgi:hypothetical protein